MGWLINMSSLSHGFLSKQAWWRWVHQNTIKLEPLEHEIYQNLSGLSHVSDVPNFENPSMFEFGSHGTFMAGREADLEFSRRAARKKSRKVTRRKHGRRNASWSQAETWWTPKSRKWRCWYVSRKHSSRMIQTQLYIWLHIDAQCWHARHCPAYLGRDKIRRQNMFIHFRHKSWNCVVWNIFFPYIGNHNPNWLIFFRGVETTNQEMLESKNRPSQQDPSEFSRNPSTMSLCQNVWQNALP